MLLGGPAESRRVADEVARAAGVTLHVRGTEISLEGEPDATALVERCLREMYELAVRGRSIKPADVGRAIEVMRVHGSNNLEGVFDDTIVQRRSGKPIAPRSVKQKTYVEAMRRHSMVFGVGPAGTGKTFLAMAMAVRRFLDKQVKRIILARPALEAGENLGFLPGTFEEKVSPYMRPLYDALFDMLDPPKVQRMMEHGTIEVAPLAYMRGRTLNDAFVILDEAQNATREQMKMFLTRVGESTWTVITGDPSQVDLPGGQKSGLAHGLRVLRGIDGIAMIRFSDKDVMRHPLVQDIVRAYERDERERGARSGRDTRELGSDK